MVDYIACPTCNTNLPPLARFCFHCGLRLQIEKKEEVRLLTVLFADLQGFTALSQKFPPDVMHEILESLFQKFKLRITEESGRILKYEGDGLMAVFGLESGSDMGPTFACYAGLKLIQEMKTFNQSSKEKLGQTINLRVGASFGSVAVVEMGNQMDLIGDPVNLAKRLEQAAEGGSILVSAELHHLVRGNFQFRARLVNLKGIQESKTAYVVEGIRAKKQEQAGILFGRMDELARLQALLERVQKEGRPHLHLVEAPAGRGKSRLIQEFAKRNEQIKTWRCQFNSTVSSDYRVFRVIFYAMGFHSTEALEKVLPEGNPRNALLARAMLQITGLEHSLHRTSAQDLALLAFEGFLLLFEHICKPGVVILIDDIHWADEGSLKLIDSLLMYLQAPLFILCSGRLERKAKNFFFRSKNCSRTDLPLLDPQSSRELMLYLLGDKEAPNEEIQESLIKQSAGNPFFMEELVRNIKTNGNSSMMPQSVYVFLQERLDQQSENQIKILKAASVMGRTFFEEALPALSLLSEPQVRSALAHFDSLGWIEPDPQQKAFGLTFSRFTHEMIREACYQRMTRRQKKQLHTALANWIEARFEFRTEHLGVLTYHYQMGGVAQKVFEYGSRLAQISLDNFQTLKARRQYLDLLKLIESGKVKIKSEQILLILDGLTRACKDSGEISKATQILWAWKEKSAEPLFILKLNLLLLGLVREEEKMVSLLNESEALNQSLSCHESQSCRLALLLSRCICYQALEDGPKLEQFARLAIDEAIRQDKKDEEIAARYHLGAAFFYKKELDLAIEKTKQGLDLARTFSIRRRLGAGEHNLGEYKRQKGLPLEAIEHFREAILLKEANGDVMGTLICLRQMAIALIDSHQINEAKSVLLKCEHQAQVVQAKADIENCRRILKTIAGQ